MTTVGLCVPQLGPVVTPGLIRDFAVTAEAMGFGHLWVQDHFLFSLDPAGDYAGSAGRQPDVYRSIYGPTEMLAAMAVLTQRVMLGTSVLVGGTHWPAPLAQRLATIDQLSGGRLIAGFGIGWSQEEHRSAGVDPRTRGDRMDDFIPALIACWGDDPVEHHGPFFDIPASVMQPKPVQRPRPRLMSGMWSERGLERTARWFDLWNPASLPIPTVVDMLASLDARRPVGAERVGVYYRAALESTAGKAMSLAELADVVTECSEAGFEGVIVETNFCSQVTTTSEWLALLEGLGPVLEAAR